jgi:hypothetical protein
MLAGGRAQKKIVLISLFCGPLSRETHKLKGATNLDMPSGGKEEKYYEGGNL